MINSPDSRCVTHPVHPEEWKQSLHELGLDRAPPGEAGRKHGRQRRAASPGISERIQNLLLTVAEEDGFCVVSTDDPNLTRENKVLERVKRDARLREGGVLTDKEGNRRYLRVSPQALKLTEDTLRRTIPDEYFKQVGQLQIYASPPDHSGGDIERRKSGPEPYIIIWAAPPFDPRRINFDPRSMNKQEQKQLEGLLGSIVPKSLSEEAVVAIVVSERNSTKNFTRRLKARLAKYGTIHPVIITREPPALPDRHQVQTSLATVIWVDQEVPDHHLGALAIDVPKERLFLLADASDSRSGERAQHLASWRRLDQDHCRLVMTQASGAPKTDALDEFAEQVGRAIERGRAQLEFRKESREIWQLAKQGVELMLNDTAIDAEIIDKAVLKPFKQRVSRLLAGAISSGSDAQTEFVRVATPLYNQAKQIYALNTDIHSTFWNIGEFDEETKKRYLAMCPTVRLFLYSTPDAVLWDLDELNYQAAHYSSHSNRSRSAATLLVADLQCYQQAFGKIDEDVAFIQLEREIWYRFSLNKREFRAVRVGENDVEHDPLFQRLHMLDQQANPGRLARLATDREGTPLFEYMSWIHGLQTDTEFLRYLQNVFRHNARSGAHRVLTFQNDGPIETQIAPERFKRIVLSVHHALENHLDQFRRAYGLRSIEYGSLIVRSPDGRGGKGADTHHPAAHMAAPTTGDYGGHPRTQPGPAHRDESRHIIILHFDTDQHLKEFSASPELEKIRFKLYHDILQARGMPVVEGWEEKKYITEVMKRAGNRYLTIHDYTDRHEPADWTEVLTQPPLHPAFLAGEIRRGGHEEA